VIDDEQYAATLQRCEATARNNGHLQGVWDAFVVSQVNVSQVNNYNYRCRGPVTSGFAWYDTIKFDPNVASISGPVEL
jgi:hypothetical protein